MKNFRIFVAGLLRVPLTLKFPHHPHCWLFKIPANNLSRTFILSPGRWWRSTADVPQPVGDSGVKPRTRNSLLLPYGALVQNSDTPCCVDSQISGVVCDGFGLWIVSRPSLRVILSLSSPTCTHIPKVRNSIVVKLLLIASSTLQCSSSTSSRRPRSGSGIGGSSRSNDNTCNNEQ